MKKHTEKPPIDDLFARKLGNMSLSPGSDGFARLQARMGQQKPEAKVVFWRNPAVYGYTAAAACLVLVCLFGWLYWPSGNVMKVGGAEVATNKPVKERKHRQTMPVKTGHSEKTVHDATVEEPSVIDKVSRPADTEQLVATHSVRGNSTGKDQSSRKVKSDKVNAEIAKTGTDESVLAQIKPVDNKAKEENAAISTVASAQPTLTDQPVIAAVKPVPTSERGLVVTIAEPEALVAAREAAKSAVEEKAKAVVATNDKPEKENKAGHLWQQVKRFKQGEVFARGDNGDNESGLLGRAYSGLKHSIEKDKSAKQ
ncbi:hypothetical protein [Spirosoma endbachense]|uniref:Uncharacterized protein n=1 Tax=Spirosoma endbachense TaxID=2666025 RepID=A0A6P1W089_9BACT|nr:hypothetical protein [Spirosoma endbachense]QHV98455.1 hypothetical protein GJR95_27175 [Spirosoma endbachense]